VSNYIEMSPFCQEEIPNWSQYRVEQAGYNESILEIDLEVDLKEDLDHCCFGYIRPSTLYLAKHSKSGDKKNGDGEYRGPLTPESG